MNYYGDWINVYKPKNISSFGVIQKIKRKFNILKIGHAGTLDPNAEGVLPIALEKNTKLISLINEQIKIYDFAIKWGIQTTTDDMDGEILDISKNIPSKKIIEENLKNFIGDILQKPPKVSAVKVDGKRAYQRFRNNENFEIKKRLVRVYKLEFIGQPHQTISKIRVECGKGFYVRSFARDLAEKLNTKAHIYTLKRVKVGNFNENNSILLDDLLKISEMAFGIRGIHSSISVLDDIPALEIDNNEMLEKISNGEKIRIDILLNKSLIQNDKKNFFAINKGKVISLGVIEGSFFKPRKVLL